MIDLRMLFETSVAYYPALNATPGQLSELAAPTRSRARTNSWAEYHQYDAAFHRLVTEASALGPAVEKYHYTLEDLYRFFLPYPLDQLHLANEHHAALTEALRAADPVGAADISRRHVETLHRTMVMGLLEE